VRLVSRTLAGWNCKCQDGSDGLQNNKDTYHCCDDQASDFNDLDWPGRNHQVSSTATVTTFTSLLTTRGLSMYIHSASATRGRSTTTYLPLVVVTSGSLVKGRSVGTERHRCAFPLSINPLECISHVGRGLSMYITHIQWGRVVYPAINLTDGCACKLAETI
jgi:hypothetical protein